MANVTLTYILWLFGGIFGLHHLYLNRPQHCFIWTVTWGGMFVGWLGEVALIKHYVDEANESKDFLEKMKVVKIHNPTPGFSIASLGSQFLIGHPLGNLLINAVPQYYTVEAWYGPYLSHVLGATGAAIGVYLASNIGPKETPLFKSLLAAIATLPTALFLYNRRNIYIVLCIIVASYVSSLDAKWVTKKKPKNLIGYLKMTSLVLCGVLVYCSLWTSNMYYNTRVNTLNGTKIPLREAVYNFMQTQPWDATRDAMYDMLPCLKMYSMEICQQQFLSTVTELSDPHRDIWAISVLGFDKYPTQKQINSHCRKLSSKFHPDRFTRANATEKENAEKKFLEIQKACGMLNKAKINRERKNTWSTSAAEQSETIITPPDDVDYDTDDVINEHDETYDDTEDVREGTDDAAYDSDDYIDRDSNSEGSCNSEDCS
ncbi:TM2 domain [Mactra antiquata]